MRQKSKQKHTVKKSESSQPHLLAPPNCTKPINSEFVTAVQLSAALPFAALDDSFLRARANDNNPNPRTGRAWIPKPRGAKYQFLATLIGLCEWYFTQATRAEGLPRVCNSMKHAEEVFFLPYEFQQYVRAHGGAEAFEDSSRVRVLEVLRHGFPILKKIFSGGAAQIKGIEGMEDLDSDFQLARQRKESADAGARENALADGRIHDLNHAERRMLEIAGPLRDAWQTAVKKAHRLGPGQPDIYRQILLEDLPNFLKRLNLGQPALGLYELERGHATGNDFEI